MVGFSLHARKRVVVKDKSRLGGFHHPKRSLILYIKNISTAVFDLKKVS